MNAQTRKDLENSDSDNMPEGMQCSERGVKMEVGISYIILIMAILGIIGVWCPSVGKLILNTIKDTFIIFGILFLIIALPISMIGLIPDDKELKD